MKKMSALFALSLSTAVFCGIWAFIAGPLGLLSWAGFAGCTSYFACGEHGLKGLKRSVIPNMVGVLCGVMIFMLSDLVPILGTTGIWSGVVTFVMCIIGKSKWFSYIPGTFIGCFSTFAAGGNWMVLVPSLLAGAILAISCDKGGDWLYAFATKGNSSNIDA